jgi:uncharacterized protein YcgL (UPF0745 family)
MLRLLATHQFGNPQMIMLRLLATHQFGKPQMITLRLLENQRTDNTMAKRKRTNNDLQNILIKQKNRVEQTPLITGVNAGAPEG